ncbi:MAG: methyltransferase domain-containing protein [Gemmatimonadota bacterium]|nr:methyltransferase domain-containing protein [Gemmatimonadota bacterium]
MLTAPWARVRLALGQRPLSEMWAADRGLPIHRYYLGQFLHEFSRDIKGDCLEFEEGYYCRRFGASEVAKLDILHVDNSNPLATIVADLTQPNDIADSQFDCIVCTHVLHVVFELDKAVSELHRILKPGGVLLVAVPAVSMCDPHCHELWRFTPEGLQSLLERVFGGNVTIRSYGNSLAAAGELRGLVADELSRAELNFHDPRFAVEVCARAVKLSGS